jgi:hypothetical protein
VTADIACTADDQNDQLRLACVAKFVDSGAKALWILSTLRGPKGPLSTTLLTALKGRSSTVILNFVSLSHVSLAVEIPGGRGVSTIFALAQSTLCEAGSCKNLHIASALICC